MDHGRVAGRGSGTGSGATHRVGTNHHKDTKTNGVSGVHLKQRMGFLNNCLLLLVIVIAIAVVIIVVVPGHRRRRR